MEDWEYETNLITAETLLHELQTLGTNTLCRKDLYKYLMGDREALDKYKGDPEDE